jgi:type VI protein secretion system component VasF
MSLAVWEIIAAIDGLLRPMREVASPDALESVNLVELRARLRLRLDHLRALLAERHSERDAYFVLFPLVAHYDELVKTLILDLNHMQWPPIQQELYQVADAGDLFFETLDSVLGKPETLPLVYEMYYFCLEDGFLGRHGGNPDKIADYRRKLRERIHPPALDALPPQRPGPPGRMPLRLPNYAYYGAAAALLLLVYALLSVLADLWQPVE